jgi:hypothetical protein
MGFKDIFIKSDESSVDKTIEKVTVRKEETIKFPENVSAPVERSIPTQSEPKQSTPKPSFGFGFGSSAEQAPTTPMYVPTPTNVSVTQEQIDKAYGIYQAGFDSLNQPGYDFYEYFKMVIAGGVGNTPIYAMAFAMGKSVEPKMNKEGLVNQADFYLSEINKVYEQYSTQGNTKKSELLNKKASEKQSLESDVESLKQQIETLLVQQIASEKKLTEIDSNYAGQINEIDCKITANNLAKDKIIGEIQAVKNGINNNIN